MILNTTIVLGIKGGFMPTLAENSRVIFTKQFKEKTMATISKRKMGELRWERLQQADKDGSIQKACSRRQLGALVGITDGVAADKWVYQLIKKGWLIETLTGRNGIKNVYEYHLGKKTTKTTTTETINLHDIPAPIIEREEKAKVVITLGELSVSVENGGAEYVATIIKSMR